MSIDFNVVGIIGRFVKDPEMKTLQSGTAICDFDIAVNDYYAEKEHVYFFNVSSFGKTAENISKFMKKGSQILVEGKLVQDRWEKDGEKKSRIKIMASRVQFLGGKKEAGQDQPPDVPDENSPKDDDIPF